MKKIILASIVIISAFTLKVRASSFVIDAQDYMTNFNDALMFDIELNGVTVGDSCSTFMNEKLVLGALGQFIYNDVKINGASHYPQLMEAKSLKQMCPRFAKMDAGGKAKIITLLLTTMAHFESTCNPSARQKNGPNGAAIGLYQSHQNHEDIYDGAAKFCLVNSGYKSQQSSICALSMLNLQIKNRDGEIFSSKSYWDILRPNGQASKLIKAPQLIKKALLNMSTCKL